MSWNLDLGRFGGVVEWEGIKDLGIVWLGILGKFFFKQFGVLEGWDG